MSGQLALLSESPAAYIIRRRISQKIILIRDHAIYLNIGFVVACLFSNILYKS